MAKRCGAEAGAVFVEGQPMNAPTETKHSAIADDERYWAKVYAGKIAEAALSSPRALYIREWVINEARALAKEMCKEGGE